jgi:hypothetical protein
VIPQPNLRRLPATALHLAAAPLAVLFGYTFVRSSKLAMLPVAAVIAAGAGVIALSAPPEGIFLLWFACAPFLQDSARLSSIGHLLSQVLYTLPPALFLLWVTVGRRGQRVRASLIDVLPAAYLGFVLVSLLATRVAPSPSVRGVLTTVGIAVVAYYFCAFGPVSPRLAERVCRLFV